MIERVWIVVPVGEREKYLSNLLSTLSEYKDRIIFINNSQGYSTFDGVHHIEDFGPINIHRWWNLGIQYAKEMGAKYVAVINDDIIFNPSIILEMVEKMSDGVYEISSAMGNLGAFWIIDTNSEIRADENMRWWCGDGDIFRQAKISGKLLNYETEELIHLEHNKQTSQDPFLILLGQQDLKYYRSKLEKLGQLEYW